jgi:hypothetical protein
VTGCEWNPRRSKNAEGQGVARRIRHLAVWHDPPPSPPPQGLPGFSRVGREGDIGGRTGNRKCAKPRHTTCSVSRSWASTRYGVILGVSVLKGPRLQRLGSRTGFGTGMRMAPRSVLKLPSVGATTGPSQGPVRNQAPCLGRATAPPVCRSVQSASNSLGDKLLRARLQRCYIHGAHGQKLHDPCRDSRFNWLPERGYQSIRASGFHRMLFAPVSD